MKMEVVRLHITDKDANEINSEPEIENIVSERMAQCRSSVLASQIKKNFPGVCFEKRNSIFNALQQVSKESLPPNSSQQKIILEIPRKSVHAPEETVMQEYVFSDEEKLLTDSFVQNLPISIAEKRLCRKSISVSLKRKPWSTKLQNFLKKHLENFLSYFDLWNESLNIIEGLHGAAIVSYFFFVRWLLYMNIIIFLLNFIFLVMPQIFNPDEDILVNQTVLNFTETSPKSNSIVKIYHYNEELLIEEFNSQNLISTRNEAYFFVEITNTTSVETIVEYCRLLYAQQISNDSRSGFIAGFQCFLQGTGPLEPTHLFTGFYPPFNILRSGLVYNTAVVFLIVLFASFMACFFMMVQYSSIGVEEALTVSKKSTIYSNEVFSAWEYGIKRPESADRLHHRFVFDLKTALDEDRSTKIVTERSTRMWVKLYSIRISINIFLLLWLIFCCYLIYFVAVYQMREQQEHALSEAGFRTFFLQFLPSLTLIVLNSISPILFKTLETYEKYSARVENNLSIFRNLVLYLSSIIILLNTFYNQVACKAKDICGAGLDTTCGSPRCWETYIGQQLYKLTITKIFVLIAVFVCSDALKYFILQKYDNKYTQLLGAPAFSLPSEVLGAINSQTILWLGVFYSPLLPAVMIFKLILMFYLKKVKVLKLCPPQERSYRASKINSVFIIVMKISFFVVLVVQSFAIDSISPSRGCGPFRYFIRMTEAVPLSLRKWLSVLMSYWALMITAFILCIALYYYWRTIISQKELLKRLKGHLVLQSYDKQFLLKSITELKDKKQ